ncbi:hypothetical protein ESCO_006285 [Escovopsis weberi]|uniref:Uncharacterized protein n=1 Tax=Escovopsis weberi TaxID=150374 RepID=A0A0M9VUQ8_ESCWE|nr:hypothetical protein ESCO_006285 [Escovopsis weberi]
MPRIKFVNLKLASPAKNVVANAEGDQDVTNLGTGPERLAPWWPLLEQVLAAANAQEPVQPGTGAADPDRQPIQLVAANLENIQEDLQADANESWISPPLSECNSTVIVHRAPEFCSRIIQNGVLPPLRSKQPKNWKTLERIIRYEPSGLQYPSEEEYKCWLRRTSANPNPDTLVWELYSLIDRFPAEKHYLTAIRKMIDNVPLTAAYNAGLLAPQPDFVQGIDMAGFGDVRVEHIPGAVLFEPSDDSITLAHVSGEFFGPSSSEERFAEMCGSHAGAALVFGRNSALKHLRRPDKLGHAHVLTFITNGSKIAFYAHHASKKKKGKDGEEELEYHQYPLLTTSLRDSYASFKKGWAQLRNCQLYAFEKSYELRDLLEKQHSAQGAGERVRKKGAPAKERRKTKVTRGPR